MRAEAREAFLKVLDAGLGNASSMHGSGRRARSVIDEAREQVAGALGVLEDDIVFTSGGTESDNLALFGAIGAGPTGMGLVTTRLEHAAVLEPAERLESQGVPVTYVGNNAAGSVDLEEIASLASSGPTLVSVMAANNEIGSTTDLVRLRELLGSRRAVVLHTDAVQLLGKKPVKDALEAADLATLSAHKVGGPVGVGILVRRSSVPLRPILLGGSQEAEIRPGTENVAAIAAAALAIDLAVRETDAFNTRTRELSRELWARLQAAVPDVQLNGPALDDETRLNNTLNVSFPRVGDARMLVTKLDLAGLEVSAGSACASGSLEPSHVLQALGHDVKRATSGLRISLGRTSNEDELCTAVDTLRITLGEAS